MSCWPPTRSQSFCIYGIYILSNPFIDIRIKHHLTYIHCTYMESRIQNTSWEYTMTYASKSSPNMTWWEAHNGHLAARTRGKHPVRRDACPGLFRSRPLMFDSFGDPQLMLDSWYDWLVVWTPLKDISQLGWLFPIYGKIKNVPNHQPDDVWYTHKIHKMTGFGLIALGVITCNYM